ncbi:MAG: PDZ domain-containing protein [Myxococcales bacterium FL481]|nr:MAG: PDZ domain-containing protein [Myxococcales bacterium FL481]
MTRSRPHPPPPDRGARRRCVVVAASLVLGAACGKRAPADDRSSAEATAATTATAADPSAGPSPRDTTPSLNDPPPRDQAHELAWPAAVTAALRRGIAMPTAGDRTYRVDPFVAALVYDELRENGRHFALRVPASPRHRGGFRLRRVNGHPLLSRFGLRDADVLVALDEHDLSTVTDLGTLVGPRARQVTLRVVREDHTIVLVYRLATALAWRDIVGPAAASSPEALDPSGAPEASPSDPFAGQTEGETVAAANPASPTTSPSNSAAAKPSRPRPSSKSTSSSKPPAKSSTRPKPTIEPSRPDTVPSPKTGVRCSTPGHCTISRATFAQLTSTLDRTRRTYGIVPAIRNDVHSGYKVKKVPANSPVAALGFRPGDKVTHINGVYVADDAQALTLLPMLQSTRTFRVRYERRNVARVKTILVR